MELTNNSTFGIIVIIMRDKNIFGKKLRQYRRNANISQRELAKHIGVDFSYISKVENGRLPPPAADTIVKICNVLKIDSEELLAITGKLPSKIKKHVSQNINAQEFLSEASRLNLTNKEWKSMIKSLKKLRRDDIK